MAIYNAYLEGAEREAAIFNMEVNNQYEKLSMLYEMTLMELDQAKKDIELKVFKENGTYDDLEYLISEAEAQAAGDQQNIISQILNWFASAIQRLFTNIKNFFTGAKDVPDDTDVQVDMYDNEDGLFKTVTGILDNVANMDGKITVENVLKVALGSVAGGGAILAILDKINKDHPIKTRIVKFAVAKKWDQTAQALGGKIQNITGAITKKFGDNAVIQTILDKVCKPVMDVLTTISDKCSAALQAAKTKVGQAVASATGNANNAQVQPQNGQQNAPAANGPGAVTSAKTDGEGAGARIKANFVDNTSGTATPRIAYLNKDGKLIGAKDGQPISANIKSILEGDAKVKEAVQKLIKNAEKSAIKNSPQAQMANGNQKTPSQAKPAQPQNNQTGNQPQPVNASAEDLQIELGDDYTVEVAEDGVLEITINEAVEIPADYLTTTQSIFGMIAEEEANEDPELVELQKLFEEL